MTRYTSSTNFPVVGVGASAGGLEAFIYFRPNEGGGSRFHIFLPLANRNVI